MALDRFFTGLNDIDIAKDAVAKNPDVYIQKFEAITTGVYAIPTGGSSTLTPATSPAWTINDYASTVAKNLLVVDDNNLVCQGKVTSNDADSITFDETTLLLESDGVTPGSFTVGNPYSFVVLTPSSVTGNTYGPFFGMAEGLELNISDTFMKMKYSKPKKLIFKDLDEREVQITGGNVNFINEDVIEAVFGASNYGSQTGQYSKGIGSDPNTNTFYRISFLMPDRSGRNTWVICRKCQFESTGNFLNEAESGHKMLNFTADVTADAFYPDTADYIQVIHSDT